MECDRIDNNPIILPKVKYKIDTFELWVMRLSRLGYGDIPTIRSLDVQTFMNLIRYENFSEKYMRAVKLLNQKE